MAEAGSYGAGNALPIVAFRDDIVASVARHSVTIVKGDTGSGKSSQLPQYLLETSMLAVAAARGNGGQAYATASEVVGVAGRRQPPVFVPPEVWGSREPNIYVTQPRRVAAVTLARRVAGERGEEPGGIVGYRIGHDAVAGPKTRITFCTTGWLLQWLVSMSADDELRASGGGGGGMSDGGLGLVSHIVIDEVHERGIDTDLTCLVIKLALRRSIVARARAIRALAAAAANAGSGAAQLRAAAEEACAAFASRPRVVLMSATFDTTAIVDYFGTLAEDARRELVAEGGGLDIAAPLLSSSLSRLCRSSGVPAVPTGLPPPLASALTGSLGELLLGDTPVTLYVGAKRYPVRTVFLEGVYSDAPLKERGMPRSEAQQCEAARASFDKAASAWASSRGSGVGGGDVPPSVGVADALTLNDVQAAALCRVAARIAIAAARPHTGDCILIFVAGMADIDKVVEAFQECAPGLVAAPATKLVGGRSVGGSGAGAPEGGGEDDGGDDADMLGLAAASNMAPRHAAAALVDSDSDSDGDDSDDDADAVAEVKPTLAQAIAVPLPLAPIDTGRSTIRLLPMHSLISFEDQMAAFAPGGGDTRTRVVIATNIAESSVTLPDVHTVIDFGRAKTVEFVPKLHASALRTTWVSQASAAQRAGRAGRLMPGTVYRLYTKSFFEKVMPRYDTPEMLRLALDAVVLKVKMLGIRTAVTAPSRSLSLTAAASGTAVDASIAPAGAVDAASDSTVAMGTSAKAVLRQSIQCPDASNVDAALEKLAALGALASSADDAPVTPFGRLLAAFPGDLALGKLVAVGVVLGAAAVAVVLAAALGAGDVFLMPHAAVASSPAEFISLTARVVHARWRFAVDGVVGDTTVGAAGGSSATGRDCGSWSDPIAARNAYIAWRATPPRGRSPWCISAGVVSRRMVTLHAMVKEIGHRIVRDVPAVGATMTALLAGESGSARGGGGRNGGTADWPPPRLFTANTHVLRLLLLAAHIGGLVVGEQAPRGQAGSALVKLGLDPSRSATIKLPPQAPPHWAASISAIGLVAAAPAFRNSAVSQLTPQRRGLIGDVPRALVAAHVVDDAAAITNAAGDAKSKQLGVEFAADWCETNGSSTLLPPTARRLALELRGSADASAAAMCPWRQPLLQALPLAVLTLLQSGGARGELALPPPPVDATADEIIAQETGARRMVPGMAYAAGTSAAGGGLTINVADPTAPVVVEVAATASVSWKTCSAASGKAAFASLPSGRGSSGHKGAGSGVLTARPNPQSLLRLAIDAASPQSVGTAAAPGRVAGPAAPVPLIAVCSALNLQERAGGAGAVTAVMAGPTLLWRDPTVLALSMLVLGRGVEALLTWTSGGAPDADAIVSAVEIDPRGPAPLRLGPTHISASDLDEVNALRELLSRQLGTPRLAALASAGLPLQQRLLRVLRLDGARLPLLQPPRHTNASCASLISDFGTGQFVLGVLLPPFTTEHSATCNERGVAVPQSSSQPSGVRANRPVITAASHRGSAFGYPVRGVEHGPRADSLVAGSSRAALGGAGERTTRPVTDESPAAASHRGSNRGAASKGGDDGGARSALHDSGRGDKAGRGGRGGGARRGGGKGGKKGAPAPTTVGAIVGEAKTKNDRERRAAEVTAERAAAAEAKQKAADAAIGSSWLALQAKAQREADAQAAARAKFAAAPARTAVAPAAPSVSPKHRTSVLPASVVTSTAATFARRVANGAGQAVSPTTAGASSWPTL